MLGRYKDRPGEGEPINIIVSSTSSPDILEPEGFLIWATALGFGVSCLGQGDPGTIMYADLGANNRDVRQGSLSGLNGVLRWNYGLPNVGTCRETFSGGNHFRWFMQGSKNGTAFFLAPSFEQSLANLHNVETDGYNRGRDQIVDLATQPGGIAWAGNHFTGTVEWIEAGRLLNATSEHISHADMALPGQPMIDGRVAVLYVKTLERANMQYTQQADQSGAASAAPVRSRPSMMTWAVVLALMMSWVLHAVAA